MTDAMANDETHEFDEDDIGPSMALPPVYVLRTVACCFECARAQHVYTLGSAASHDARDSIPIEAFHFLRRFSSLPAQVIDCLRPA